jgi:hypothetical protein
VCFSFRQNELAELDQWYDGLERFRFRTYWGAGGMGKTRLFLEECERVKKKGWSAGFLCRDLVDKSLPWNESPYTFAGKTLGEHADRWREALVDNRPLLLVIDYAEQRPETVLWLLRWLREPNSGRARCRVVLLARATGEWFAKLRRDRDLQADFDRGLASHHRLDPMAFTHKDRLESYRLACRDLARKLKGEDEARRFSTNLPKRFHIPNLANPCFDRVLRIHFAALAAVEDRSEETQVDVFDYVLNRERRFWAEGLARRGLAQERVDVLLRAVEMTEAYVTVSAYSAPADCGSAERLLARLEWTRDLPPAERTHVSELLHDAYGGERWFGPLEPDPVGTHLVSSALGDTRFENAVKSAAIEDVRGGVAP